MNRASEPALARGAWAWFPISTRQMRVLMALDGQQSDGGTHQMAKLIAFQEEARAGSKPA